ncbi:hypothetical protein, partial [Lysinibacillus fusiformis]|uniref:hypothetical protein n=1 Tax=Lysinibacillus fusiformis TaxID=28031 RepID=UPI003D060E48
LEGKGISEKIFISALYRVLLSFLGWEDWKDAPGHRTNKTLTWLGWEDRKGVICFLSHLGETHQVIPCHEGI